MLVPCSHKHGVLAAGHDTSTTYPLWTLDEETMTKLVADGGIVAPSGKPGGLLMFHGKTPGSATRCPWPAPPSPWRSRPLSLSR